MSIARTSLAPVLGLALAAGAGVARAAPPRVERLELTATPPAVRLSEGGRATIRFPARGEPPAVSVSAGRLEALRAVSGGVYEADYVPPDGVEPGVAIVAAATVQGFGWLALPLLGSREVAVRAPPRALVEVTVGGRSFGPVEADRAGRAVVRVDVPPGVRRATTGQGGVELDVRSAPAALVALDRAALDASAPAAVTVRAIAVTERGQPLAGSRPRLEASEGTLGPAAEVEPGVFQATWTLAPGRARQARVAARWGKAPEAAAELALAPGAPRAVQLEVERTAVAAGDASELRVTGRVVDAAGNPTPAAARLVASVGSAAGGDARFLPEAAIDWQAEGAGYTGRVRVPRGEGRRELVLRMIAAGGLEASRAVALLPAGTGPSRPAPAAAPPAAPPAAAPPARPAAGVAQAAPIARAGPTPPSAGWKPADLAAGGGPASPSAAGRPARTAAPAPGGAVVVGPRFGWALGAGGLSSPVAGAELGLWPPLLDGSLGLVLDVQWSTFSRADDLLAGGRPLRVRSEATFLALDAALGWRRRLLGGTAWLGAGGGAVRTSTTASTAGQGELSGRAWSPAAHGSVGWGTALGPGTPYLELRAGWQGDPGAGPVTGSVRSLTFAAGYRFDVL